MSSLRRRGYLQSLCTGTMRKSCRIRPRKRESYGLNVGTPRSCSCLYFSPSLIKTSNAFPPLPSLTHAHPPTPTLQLALNLTSRTHIQSFLSSSISSHSSLVAFVAHAHSRSVTGSMDKGREKRRRSIVDYFQAKENATSEMTSLPFIGPQHIEDVTSSQSLIAETDLETAKEKENVTENVAKHERECPVDPSVSLPLPSPSKYPFFSLPFSSSISLTLSLSLLYLHAGGRLLNGR